MRPFTAFRFLRPSPQSPLPRFPRRFASSKPPSSTAQSTSSAAPSRSATESRISKLPARLQPYAQRFKDRPASHITAFLVLHELTAIVPLLGLVGLFRVTDYSPVRLVKREWMDSSLQFWAKWADKKGWEIFKGDKGPQLVIEIATAWALVKAAMPARLLLSAWATPWTVRVATKLFRRGR